MKCTIGVTALALAALPCALAAIEFERKVVDLPADPGSDKVTATFAYKNTGSAKERIYRIETNCGCLSAKADRTSLGPGESGTLTAVFTVKGKSGRFGKSLTVMTGSGDSALPFAFGSKNRLQATELEVRVTIPELVILQPNSVVWKVGENPAPKTVRVEMNHGSPIRVLKVDSSRPTVTASLTTVKEGKTYEVKITPQSTASPLLGVIRLETDAPIAEQRRQMAFFRIEK